MRKPFITFVGVSNNHQFLQMVPSCPTRVEAAATQVLPPSPLLCRPIPLLFVITSYFISINKMGFEKWMLFRGKILPMWVEYTLCKNLQDIFGQLVKKLMIKMNLSELFMTYCFFLRKNLGGVCVWPCCWMINDVWKLAMFYELNPRRGHPNLDKSKLWKIHHCRERIIYHSRFLASW